MVVATLAAVALVDLTRPLPISSVRSPEARIAAEVTSLDGAYKAYKERYGSFPPSDFTRLDDPSSSQYIALRDHLAKAFPQCDPAVEIMAIQKLGVRTPAQALCFWLGGFSNDPERPISDLALDPAFNGTPWFPFDQSRLQHPGGKNSPPVYVPASGDDAPYVYFSAVNYELQPPFDATSQADIVGCATPYRSDDGAFVNPRSFQIISAGLDGDYGGGVGSFPSGLRYESGDQDNITNFSCGTTLGNNIPAYP
jgi:hypothetical protein